MNQRSIFDVCRNNHKGDANSEAANQTAAPSKQKICSEILGAIQAVGHIGRTCDEIESLLGLPHQTASARISELKRDGKIRIIGKRKTRTGSPAAVYVAARPGDFKWMGGV